MKLVVQIPCFNEEETLPQTLADLPRELPGIDEILWLVIDDGSRDSTMDVAREHGVDAIVRLTTNSGLAIAFQAGMDAALKMGADIIVNTDADNQYVGADIARLVEPIVGGEADFVVGDRQIRDHPEFSDTKKRLQSVGSWVVRQAAGSDIPDTTSGFRAYSRQAALNINVVSRFTYTLETIIHAGRQGIAMTHVPIRTNPKTRDSRLFSSIRGYVSRSTATILRVYAMHEPLKVFLVPALIFALFGTILFARFGVLFLMGDNPSGHVQSLILGAVTLIFGIVFLMMGVLGELLRVNRILAERSLRSLRRIELHVAVPPDTAWAATKDEADLTGPRA